MATIREMWYTILKIQANLDDLLEVVERLEKDEVARSWFAELYPKRKGLRQTVVATQQLMEGLVRQFKESWKVATKIKK